MAFPDFYRPDQVGELYRPDVVTAVEAGRAAGLSPAESDTRRVMLLLIDAQVDFIHPDGALAVPGAVDDTRRTVEWLLTHAGEITHIAASLDSHIPIQIFSPTWWRDPAGNPPQPNTVITAEQVDAGDWLPLFEPDWSRQYVHRLEDDAKKQLMIWPFHTLIGTPGHNIMPAIYEAIAYHSAARGTQPELLLKGSIAKTEYYSALEPEVKVDDHPQGTLNTAFLDKLTTFDRVYITGQAKSHCVLETTTTIMNYFRGQPDQIARFHLIEDATSSVAHPEIDFERMAVQNYDRFESEGLTRTTIADATP